MKFYYRILELGSHFLPQEIFPMERENPARCPVDKQILYSLSQQGSLCKVDKMQQLTISLISCNFRYARNTLRQVRNLDLHKERECIKEGIIKHSLNNNFKMGKNSHRYLIKNTEVVQAHFLFYISPNKVMYKFFLRKLNPFLIPHSQLFLQSTSSNYLVIITVNSTTFFLHLQKLYCQNQQPHLEGSTRSVKRTIYNSDQVKAILLDT